MAIKMRYLYASGKKKFVTIGDIVKQKFALTNNNAVDVIPPAYNCDKERLLIAGISSGKNFSDDLSMFLRGLTKAQVQNVAIFTDSKDDVVATMKSYIEGAGAKVVDVKKVKGSFLPFLSGVKPEEMEDLKAWAKKVIEDIQ